MALNKKEQRIIEQYFGMATGYVLHYSNRTFEEFFNQFDIDIYDDKYCNFGDSKAKRLRSFFNQHNDNVVGEVLLAFIEDYDVERDSNPHSYQSQNHNEALRTRSLDIANRLAKSTDHVLAQPIKPIVDSFNSTPPQPQRRSGWNLPDLAQSNKQVSNEPQEHFQQLKPAFVPQQVKPIPPKMTLTHPTPNAEHEKVFIVHGHDEHLLTETENLCLRLGLEPIILKNQHSGGRTIIEKLEAHSNVKYAIILYTACDEGRNKGQEQLRDRARQNVVFEHGYFIGKLGRGNVAAVVKGNVEIQGDIGGVVYVPVDSGGWKYNLSREMKGANLAVDLNKL